MNTRIALVMFWFGIITLTFFAGAIIFRLIIWPPCTLAGTACVIDSWSVAGLASTVLGIAATMLGILGAVAVAAWWVGLNKRVTKRVTKLFAKWQVQLDKEVKDILAEKEENALKQFAVLLNKQDDLDRKITMLDEKIADIGYSANNIINLALDAALINPPWKVENWAIDAMKKFDKPEIAQRMVFAYLAYIDDVLPLNPGEPTPKKPIDIKLFHQNAPVDPEYYLKEALRWKQILDDYYLNIHEDNMLSRGTAVRPPEIQRQVAEKVISYKQKIDAWKKP